MIAQFAHTLLVDYFPFTFCGLAGSAVAHWSRFLRDLDDM